MSTMHWLGWSIAIGMLAARALAESYTTNLVDGVISNAAGSFVLGQDGPFNVLIITNGGKLLSTGGILGKTAPASNNFALVTGAGSAWDIQGGLYVGFESRGNELVIENGGRVSNRWEASIGEGIGTYGNTVRVSGAGSRWTNTAALYVGKYGFGNSLVIEDGGRVFNTNAFVGRYLFSSNNLVRVSGVGSTWTHVGDLHVGAFGSSNRLVIEDGGMVRNFYGIIGHGDPSTPGSAVENEVRVTGMGAVWSNAYLDIGRYGPRNRMVVENGGKVRSSYAYLGSESRSSQNVVIVSGAGSTWQVPYNLRVGSRGSGNRMRVLDGGTVSNGNGSVGGTLDSYSNSVEVSGSGSAWICGDGLTTVGWGNQITIAEGGVLRDRYGSLGGSNNTITVMGPGSLWENRDWMALGTEASGNRLVIRNGGWVDTRNAYVGSQNSSLHNEAVVTDVGSTWSIRGNLWVSYSGSVSRVVVSNGGVVAVASNLWIGFGSGSSGNLVRVNGGSLICTNSDGTGKLDVRRGLLAVESGSVTVDRLTATNGAEGLVTLSAGMLSAKSIEIANGAPFEIGDGVRSAILCLQGGTHRFANGLVVRSGSEVRGAAQVEGSLTSSGVVSPGTSVGELTVAGDYLQEAGGTLQIELADALSYDVLAVSGGAQLDGALTVTNVNGFMPALSDTFTILTAGAISGTFASLHLPWLGGALDWAVSYEPTAVVLRVENGTSPYALWAQSHIADPAQRHMGLDLDGDGFDNWGEYLADTDPTDGARFPALTRISRAAVLTVHFDSRTGRLYTLQASDELDGVPWSSVPGAGPRPGVGGADAFADTNQPVQGRFYRLKIETP